MTSSASSVRSRAAELGFEKVGIAPAGRAPRADFLRRWLGEGRHGSMEWLDRAPERREDATVLLPGAKSVIVVAKNYHTPDLHSSNGAVGRISRYAWGDDYHEVLLDRLHDLRRHVESLGGVAKVAVDTNAILEKPWAQAAGLGWQGKHTNLISRDFGSWIFLGEVVTDLALEPDAPHVEDFCGTCTACIDVCPTKAITGPYQLDARLCISYLTIEHRGPIPRELRPAIGNLIYGCDLCQDVCPWNKYAQTSPEPAFRAREGNVAPKLVELMALTRDEWTARFKGSPVKRAKYAGFLRNVAIALGNSGDASAIPALERALVHEEPLVRGHAAWALGRLGARAALEARRPAETDPHVLEEIDAAFASG